MTQTEEVPEVIPESETKEEFNARIKKWADEFFPPDQIPGDRVVKFYLLKTIFATLVEVVRTSMKSAKQNWKIVDTQTRLSAIEARLAGLEQRKSAGVSYAGVHIHAKRYLEGQLCTRGGSLWLCTTDTVEAPGQSSSWKLVVKRGEA